MIITKYTKHKTQEKKQTALLVLPVAFDNQGGLAWQQRGKLPVWAVASVQVFLLYLP